MAAASVDDNVWSYRDLLRQQAPFLESHAIEVLSVAVAIVLVATAAKWRRYRRQENDDVNKSTPLMRMTEGDDSGSVRETGSTNPAVVKRRPSPVIEDREGYVLGTGTYSNIFSPTTVEDDGNLDLVGMDWKFIPFKQEPVYSEAEMIRRSRDFYELMNRRRTVRMFSDRPVPREAVENIILTAGTGPSGAHTEPWTFVIVSDPILKAEIRHVTELEERINYDRRMGDRWVADLRKLNTEWQKPYLETAPYLILVFVQTHGYGPDGRSTPHYYHQISSAISTGLLLAAIHNAGLVTVTSTPMNAGVRYQELLERPPNEKFLMLLPIGYASDDAQVPDLHRKPLADISVWR